MWLSQPDGVSLNTVTYSPIFRVSNTSSLSNDTMPNKIRLETYPYTVTDSSCHSNTSFGKVINCDRLKEALSDRNKEKYSIHSLSNKQEESLPTMLTRFPSLSVSQRAINSTKRDSFYKSEQRNNLHVLFNTKYPNSPKDTPKQFTWNSSIPSHVIKISKRTRPQEQKRTPLPSLARHQRSCQEGRQNIPLCKEINLIRALERDQSDTNSNRKHIHKLETLLTDQATAHLTSLSRQSKKDRKDVEIVIIGAGLAGLSAADRLLSRGFKKVIILEAQDRRVIGQLLYTYIHCLNELVKMGYINIKLTLSLRLLIYLFVLL